MKNYHAGLILLIIPVLLGSTSQFELPGRIHYPDNRQLVNMVLRGMGIWTKGSASLVLRTGAVESLYHFRSALNEAPELGYWQIHPETANDILFRYLQRPSKADLKEKLEDVLGYSLEWLRADPERLNRQLRENDILGIALCRLWYGMAPYHIPRASNLWAQALLWKRWFNTDKGGGTVQMFVEKARPVRI